MQVQPYLFFDGRADEAIEFYKKALGAKVNMLMRFKDAPPQATSGGGGGGDCKPDPANAEKVMHAQFSVGDTVVMASDGDCKGDPKFGGFALSITADNDAEAQRVFAAVSEGGKVIMPLTKTFFSSAFGMVHDKFGVMWMVMAGR
jgi:PhnB protein